MMRTATAWWEGRVTLLLLDVAAVAWLLFFDLFGDRSAQDNAWYPVAVCALALAAVVRRRFPFALLVVALAGLFAGLTLMPLFIAMYSVAARFGASWVSAGAVVLACGVVSAWQAAAGKFELSTVPLGFFMFGVGPALGGLWMHQRATLLKVLRERAEEAERTRTLLAEQAVTAERQRIAREMHDVVAHRVTAIALQAGALSVNATDERTERSAETIRQVSVTALDELRDILKVLREEDGGRLTTLVGKDLLASVRELADGTTGVTLDLPEEAPAVSARVGRAVYRVVQESLTNAGKHAPGAKVSIRVAATETEMTVGVTNPLTPSGAEVPGSGYGLVGMRERVELAAGELRTGRTGSVFQVLARFPLEAS
ncbi:sensor histidine kinase [Allokutzneria sp. NRRL B-24872]|uniref:sensor histidine kinase n=1 Tax=Allokutzneria sp. NRRL B-24872 TaxID=1137961 RepID=UPI001178248D|nr:histidine kinase [Allokutzneria sp. NRRL B-24872]